MANQMRMDYLTTTTDSAPFSTGTDKIIEQLAASLYSTETSSCTPDLLFQDRMQPISASSGTVDVSRIIIELSETLANARGEIEKERSMRRALEEENERLTRLTDQISGKTSFDEDALGKSGSYMASYDGYSSEGETNNVDSYTTMEDFSGDNLRLSECLKYIGSLPPHMQEAVYISYSDMSICNLDLTNVISIMRPVDLPRCVFIFFTDYISANNAVSSCGHLDLMPYSLENIQSLIPSASSSRSITIDLNASMNEDGLGTGDDSSPPRMNLLEALNVQSDEDIGRIVTVRKCHKLGFKSHVFLKQYFSRFGTVERVVLLPMRAKPKSINDGGNRNSGSTVRPSSMGFVVMTNEESVDKILSFDDNSGVHIVKGWPIEVRNFVRPADKPGIPSSSSTISW